MKREFILAIVIVLLINCIPLVMAHHEPEPEVEVKTVYKELPVYITVVGDTIVGPVVTEVIGTIYNPVAAQCDSDPLTTADNSLIDLDKLKKKEIRWIALSRDLLARWGGPYNYGDSIYIHHPDKRIRGVWIVHDTMNARFSKRMDFLVDTKHNKNFPHKTPHILISNREFYVAR